MNELFQVTEFEIDMTSPDNNTRTVYRGHDTECVVASLLPGRPYLFQVRAHNRAGPGPWSESLEVVSGAGAPDQPTAPSAVIRSPTVVALQWTTPINNGAIITEFILQVATVATRKCPSPPPTPPSASPTNGGRPDARRRMSVSSNDDSSDALDDVDNADDLSDDESMDSEYEDDDESHDGGAAHRRKVVKRKKASHSNLDDEFDESDSDDEDINNDDIEAAVTMSSPQRQQQHQKQKHKTLMMKNQDARSTDNQQHSSQQELATTAADQPLKFVTLYSGPQSSFEARNLNPATTYLFRVGAVNAAGPSNWSEGVEVQTPPSVPGAVNGLTMDQSTATSLTIRWTRPAPNGEPITHYNVENPTTGVVATQGPSHRFLIDRLKPDTSYTIRVQAVNSVGPGPFGSGVQFSTRPLPPAPPRCECVNANHNSLKLKWGDSKSVAAMGDLSHFTLEMENSRNQ